jgi:hypothetical protein
MDVDTAGYIGIGVALAALTVMGGYISYRLCTNRGRATRSNTHKQYLADVGAREGKKIYMMQHASVWPHDHRNTTLDVERNRIHTNTGASRGFQPMPPRPATTRGAQVVYVSTKSTQPIIRTPPKVVSSGHRTSKGEVDLWRSESSISLAPVEPARLKQRH